jgi:hypothetical protein
MIKCINSNIEIYSENNYDNYNWSLVNNNGIFNILNNSTNIVNFCILQNGNVGIGSTSPKSTLDIVGAVNILGITTLSSNLVLKNVSKITPLAQIGTSTNAQSNIYFTGGSNARIGIGSSSPNASLDIVGTANVSGLITANGGIMVPLGTTLNTIGEIDANIINATTINTATINADLLNVTELIYAVGGIFVPSGNAILAQGGIFTSTLNATQLINANRGITVSAGSFLTANGGIITTTISTSGLINANGGITVPAEKSLIANGGISATTLETSGTITAKTTTLTTPLVQFGTNLNPTNNIYFVGGGRARIGIGSSNPAVSLDIVGDATISGAILTNTIGVSSSISANTGIYSSTIIAGGLITANGGITVPSGKLIIADGGIEATTIKASGLITANNGISATSLDTFGFVNANGGITTATIVASGLIKANAGLNASTITSSGIINATAGLSVTTINATAAITGTTIETSSTIKTVGGLITTTIDASQLITANNGLIASSINSTGMILADRATATIPIAQFGKNTNVASNLYFIGGGTARIGIGSSAPNVPLDIIGGANISGLISANGGISATTISASGLLSANNGISATTINALNSITVSSTSATTPITQIGTNTNTASNLYFIGGGTPRIGIGSSLPGYSLDIIGDTNITGAYRKNNRDVINDTSNYILSTSNIIVNRLGDYLPYTWIINSQSFNLNYTLGNVGIGTTEPVKKLHVMHPTGELIRIETNTNDINQVSGIEFGIPSYNSATRSKITSTTYGNYASDLQFSTASATNNSSVKMSITPTGNVGIGTTNPPNILQIGNAGRLRVANNISDYTIIGTADADDATNTKIEISGNTRNDASQGGNISYVATNTNGYHQFITNSTTERMRVTSGGNVGIGTTNPEQLLTLLGDNAKLKIKNKLNNLVSINLENGIGSEWIICNSNNKLSFDYNNNLETSNRFIIDGVSGNIGIGTTPYIYRQDDVSNYILNIVGNIKVAGDIIPTNSNVYNLGSTSNKWKDLYLSGNSIYLDDLIISRDSNVNLNIKDLLGNYKSINLSNIQLNNINNSNNNLTIGIDVNGNIVFNSSNKTYYPVTTTNIENTELLNDVNKTILDTSNYAIETSNILSERIATLDNNASNYQLSTSNIISKRITDLTTDMINENLDGAKKFIINHRYNNDLLVNGDLTVNNNLIVLGDSTRLDTIVYTTERLEVINANNTTNALMVQQKDAYMDIFVASNLSSNVFNIANNGDVNITGIYKKNNRDVFYDTSNYILTASNNLINKADANDSNSSNYVATTSNILYNNIAFVDCKLKLLTLKVNLNDTISSNYIIATSNVLAAKATLNDNNTSNYILTASNNLINKVKENDNNTSNYILTASNNLINKVKENDNNTSNYILTASNNLINKVKENDNNTSNYILTASNNLINKVKENDNNTSNYILTASNNLINKVKENDENASNYILTASNNLINKVKENDENASNYILTASNNLINKVKENDENASNYILTASNNLINKVKENDNNTSNYILTASNNLINKVKENDNNTSNYILTASNNLINKVKENDNNTSNYILTASNNLINKVKENDENASNYILTASNNLINKVKENDNNTSNYILTASNNLINKVKENDNNTSNYILTTSNIISKRITDLTTDMINENLDSAKKFIINHSYNNNLLVNGDLIINSNLIVHGDSTILETTVYTTERLEVINANNNTTALMVQQKGNSTDVFVASNLTTNVFNIATNGDVNILGIYRKNNRDVFFDTSNYILTASNNLINKVKENDNNTSNYILTASNNLINKVKENDNNTSNYILTASNNLINKVKENDNNTSNYILTASNNLINKVKENDNNTSNYILTASNNLINKVNENDNNTSNYILTASNNLINKVKENDNNTSNYILTASNNLINKVKENDNNTSNYILTASNNLINKVKENDNNTSNYILTASNNLINKVKENDNNTSNYILTASNNLINKVKENDNNTSNYILTASNVISKRITDLTTDMITENISAANKFIVNNRYNNNLELNGTLTINSNLIVLGDSTQLDTVVYTTERLEVINANNTTTALMVQQKGNNTDVFIASNLTTNVFNIGTNGDVNILGIYRKNNRDVFFDTSNYILTASNNLINKVKENDNNTSNYILTASNNLINKVKENDNNTSNYILTASNNLINKVKENDNNTSNYILTASNNLINKVKENDNNTSNYILTASNNLINKVKENDNNTSNYILTASNNLINKVKENDNNTSNYILTASNNLINKVKENDYNTSNYILTASNNLINKVKENDNNTSNYILTASNNLINKVKENDENASNYILTASNNLINKVKENDNNTSNYILTASNNLINKVKENDNNTSNFILSTSNFLSDRLYNLDQLTSNIVNNSIATLNTTVSNNNTNTSNYILFTSNIISKRITDLTTDMITENINATNKFIVNNKYDNDLFINGDLTINSNLIVLGDSTILETTVYTTERLEVINANNTTTALMVQQKGNSTDIFIASNLTTNVFNIANNGDVNITGIYKKNNRDVIFDTSNFILSTSNFLSDRLYTLDQLTSNIVNNSIATLNTTVRNNNENTSNFILSTSNFLSDRLYTLDQLTSNIVNNSIATLNTTVSDNNTNTSNFILSTSNFLSDRLYTLDQLTSNIVNNSIATLNITVSDNNTNTSNFILSTSNFLSDRLYTLDQLTSNIVNNSIATLNTTVSNNNENTSNFILSTSNFLSDRLYTLDQLTSNIVNNSIATLNTTVSNNNENTSNFILSTSNFLSDRLYTLDQLTSNIVNNSIATLNTTVSNNNENTSNFILSTSNFLSDRLYTLDQLTSNIVNNSIATLNTTVSNNNENTSNFILSTSNIISKRITDLTTDMITENINATNKFIVNNKYDNDLFVNGNLTINSNLIVLGDSTVLETTVYTTERLEVINANNTTTALMVQQKGNSTDIFIASNLTTNVFNIANNGDVNITGIYKKNNRDVFFDTSNYVLSTSNILSNRLYILDQLTSNIVNNSISTLNIKVNANDANTSNYVLSTSNILAERINKYSVWTPTTSNIYYYSTGNVGIGTTTPESKLHICDNSSNNTKLIIQNSNVSFNSIQPDIIIAGTTLTTIGTDKCITFPYSGSSITKSYTFTTSTDIQCDILVIGGGGGGGGSYVGGGGGGGGYVYLQNISIPSGNHTVNVGSGGSATSSLLGWWGGNGGNSSITGMVNYIAQGGGGGSGGSAYTSVSGIGNNGGSGGGGSYKGPSKTISAGGISTQFSTYGYGSGGNGGSYDSPFLYGGGGGGAGGSVVGGNYNGANGLSNSITGSLVTYAGGGGAGSDLEPVPQGGTGGGGPGANGYGTLAIAGTNGLGGGGGGARGRGTGPSAPGGSGIVIIRYRSSSSSSYTSSSSAASIEFIRGTQGDTNTDYKIGNYDGDFKIISSYSNIDRTHLLLTSNGNLTLGGSFNATSYLLNGNPFSIATEVGYTSNYISTVNTNLINQINELNDAQLNYVLSASSNLGDGLTTVIYNMNTNDRNSSNYVLTTSNVIQQRINEITTDKIVEGPKNRFIIENKYNSNLEINGNLVINSNLIVNKLATLNNNLNITGDVNFTGDLYKNGMIYPNGKTYTGSSSILSQYSPIQTQFSMYKNVVEKSGSGWQFIDNNINIIDDKVQGFCVRIKPNHYSSKILINLNCHIGIDYGTDARWWGLRLYRKIGETGEWTHISNADGTDYNNNNGTTCWLSHNLGADSSTHSYFIANVSGAYYDIPGISEDYIYYTAKWCSLLGDNTQNGKLYLNRPAIINALNAPIVSSSWNVSEIWQLETSYFPKGGIVTKYTPTQTQFNIYKNVVEKLNGGWQFIDNNINIVNNNIQGFCVRIRPNHYTSKILINLTCHVGIDYGTDARWWGLRLYRKIGETGEWTHITDANGNNYSNGTPCWLSHNLGAESSTYSYFIANVSGAYYDMPNAMDTYVYYTVQWCSQLGDAAQNGKLYLNRPATYNSSNSAVLSSSWNAQEIWQLETTFIPKNAVICQNMSIQTLFNIYRNIVVKTGYGWQFIDNNINIINEKIQGFCVRIKPTHPSSKVLVHVSCHIGIDYGTDARWWGLRLYRKIGEAGEWAHISDADGNNLIDNQGTSCWLSHNLGAESSTSSYFVANISGSFFDLPGTSSDFVYYTAKWCSILGDNSPDGKIYLNRPAYYNNSNSAVLSSSWNAQEIWQLGTPYEPAEYSIINIFNNNNVGIGNTNPICKLDVNGTINAINYSTISDRRFKKDIRPINSSLELINRISPVSYLTIEQNEGDRKNYGFIAQDLHNIIPEAVNVPANESHKYTIEYMSIIPLLTKSIQELSEKINNQQKTIDDLNDKLSNMSNI